MGGRSTIQRHEDTCESIVGRRKTLWWGALGVAGGEHTQPFSTAHGSPSRVTMTQSGVLTWGSGL